MSSFSETETVLETVPIDDLIRKYNSCRGKGSVESDGIVKGKLSYEFSADGNSGYIQFYDLLGRKSLFILMKNKSVSAWDMVRNKRYNKDGIFTALPFINLMSPSDFFQVLWGSIPSNYLGRTVNKEFRFESTSASISFDSKRTEYGSLLYKVVLESTEENYRVTIKIKEREMNATYPRLERKIPESVPLASPA